MPRHKSLTLKRFVDSISPDLMERYFEKTFPRYELPYHIIMDTEVIEDFMSDPRNAEAKALIKEDFAKINDICDKGKNHVVRAYRQYGIPLNDKLTLQSLAMRLFLDYPEAFDYAFAWHSYYDSSSKMSHHHLPSDKPENFELTDSKIKSFQSDTKQWFENLAKGTECVITPYNEDGLTVILIKHGSYIRTVAHWKDETIQTISYRPANEDLLLYNREKGMLSIKASLEKDRVEYVRLFSKHLMNDETLAEREDINSIYSLKSIQDGTFSWNGNEIIRRIILTKIKLVLNDNHDTVHEITSQNVLESLKDSSVKLNGGILTYAKFRFVLDIDGKEQKITFMISPPDVSDLAQKKYADIISDYLKSQGVKRI